MTLLRALIYLHVIEHRITKLTVYLAKFVYLFDKRNVFSALAGTNLNYISDMNEIGTVKTEIKAMLEGRS